MNVNEVATLCRKIKDCDKVIHEQQLGISWSAPTDPVFQALDRELIGKGTSGGLSAQASVMQGQNTS
jgi:hypothetical protein